MSKQPITYAELERASRRDLATRTILDPSSPPEHVTAARAVLERDSLAPMSREYLARMLTPLERRAILDIIRTREGRGTDDDV